MVRLQGREEELTSRKLLLDFYSSQLSTHARLIIGFAIILLTLLNVRVGLESLSDMQLGIFYISISATSFCLWFLLWRHLMYGILASAATHAPLSGKGTVFDRVIEGSKDRAMDKRMLGVVPIRLFYSTTRKGRTRERFLGVFFCGVLALITACLVWILMEMQAVAAAMRIFVISCAIGVTLIAVGNTIHALAQRAKKIRTRSVFCTRCGTKNTKGNDFCKRCGNKLRNSRPTLLRYR